MEEVLYILAKSVEIYLAAVMLAMMVRAVFPLLADTEGNVIYGLACILSEPFILPFRYIFAKFNIGQDSPLDLAFLVTYLFLIAARTLLPAI